MNIVKISISGLLDFAFVLKNATFLLKEQVFNSKQRIIISTFQGTKNTVLTETAQTTKLSLLNTTEVQKRILSTCVSNNNSQGKSCILTLRVLEAFD